MKKFLVLTLLVAAATASALESQSISVIEDAQPKWDGLGLSADVNEYVDNTISMIVPFLQQNGLDPLVLPDIIEGFEVRYILITYSAWLRLTNGAMTGLVNVARSGDQNVNYFAKMLRVRVVLEFSDLEFNYNYRVEVMNIGPTGTIHASLDRFVVVTDILIDFNNDEIHLQEFSLTDVGRIRARLGGNILTDWLVNPVISVFLRIVDNLIMDFVQVSVRNVFHLGIDFINTNLKDIIRALEAM